VPEGHALDVGGTLNVVSFDADLAGEVTITGHGAGSAETASALVSDLAAVARKP
jgi:homoserine dehydrogenase